MIRSGTRTWLAWQGRKKFRQLQPDAADNLLAADAFRQQFDIDPFLRGKYDGALDDIFQLADVPRPIVIHKELHGSRGERTHRFPVFEAITLQEIRKQSGNVLAALAKRREQKVNHV